jgi:hypothetical protein
MVEAFELTCLLNGVNISWLFYNAKEATVARFISADWAEICV